MAESSETIRPGQVFISHSGSETQRTTLVKALAAHGLQPWRYVEDLTYGDDTTESIKQAIASSSAAVLWIDAAFLDSEYIASVEMPAINEARSKTGLKIIPVFDGWSPNEASALIQQRWGIELQEHYGHVVKSSQRVEHTAAAVARGHLPGHVQAAKMRGAPPVVRFATRDDTAPLREQAVLNFDWRDDLKEGVLDEQAQARLSEALREASSTLKTVYGGCEVTLAVKSHLPVAVALGAAFAEPTGCTLRLPREDDDWVTSEVSATPLKEVRHPQGPVSTKAAALMVSVARDVNKGMKEYGRSANRRYRMTVELRPAGGLAHKPVDGVETANAWARQIAVAIKQLTGRSDVDEVDLFMSAPIELAVMLGWRLNAAGRVRILDWYEKNGPYKLMWTLP